uniref:Uncharacterized protein n=1 Tax=Nymphaea colorata TaxID=210225 RepID=A0A5K0W2Z0_9MAGN
MASIFAFSLILLEAINNIFGIALDELNWDIGMEFVESRDGTGIRGPAAKREKPYSRNIKMPTYRLAMRSRRCRK